VAVRGEVMNEPDEEILRRFQEKYEQARDALESGSVGKPESPESPESPVEEGLANRLSEVQGALRKISQGAVSRQSLNEAVRSSLEEVLAEKRDEATPDVSRLGNELEQLRKDHVKALAGLRDEVRVALSTLRSDLSKKFARLADEIVRDARVDLEGVETALKELSEISKLRCEVQEVSACVRRLHADLDKCRVSPAQTSGEQQRGSRGGLESVVARLDDLGHRVTAIESKESGGEQAERLESALTRLLLLELLERQGKE